MNLRSISQFIASRILGEANGLSRLVPPNTGPTGLNVSSLCSPNDTTEVSAGLRATRSRRSGLDVAENHAWKSLASSRLTAAASEGSCTAMTASTQPPTRAWARPTLGRVRVTAATRSGSPAVRNPRHRGAETRHAFSPRSPMSPSSSHSFTLHSCPGVENPLWCRRALAGGSLGKQRGEFADRAAEPRADVPQRLADGGLSLGIGEEHQRHLCGDDLLPAIVQLCTLPRIHLPGDPLKQLIDFGFPLCRWLLLLGTPHVQCPCAHPDVSVGDGWLNCSGQPDNHGFPAVGDHQLANECVQPLRGERHPHP